ncbi:AMP-binding enzyme C-terminal domain-containing protein [Micromonospora eburnea]|uniref:AMP-binding enzyme C-terminal domain-containing protein n=1 Tax=Micromonospora eburnea TaxID=227316 RepID=A0A1C6V197_9ACTN|nr:AMP-binding enzyme C-terminal domain-containing protein [Micromonospora eburnea]
MLEQELISYLRQLLPEYMVPSAIVVLEALPQTPNHKVDVNALPEVTVELDMDGAPGDDLERDLAGFWGQILHRDEVGVHNDFFQLGGNSLQAMRVIAHIRKTYGVGVPAQHVFEQPTVAALAARVRDAVAVGEGKA